MKSILLNNRYRIIQALSSGGFGETFLAQDTQMPSGRYCVIKQLKLVTNNPQIYQQVLQRFQREAAILEELGETNSQIPQLYAYFSDTAGQFYLVQEWIEGKTLAETLETQGPMTDSSVQKILINLLSVINYIHSRNIIHRDIKPENIILRQQDNLPVLIDFGAVKECISTAINSQNTTPISIMIGTPGYMAFEQAAGRPVYASDLYSLGLTAIYLLTGKAPQDLEMDLQTGKIIWQQYTKNLTPKLAAILDKAIQPNISDRFATSQEMLGALQLKLNQPFTNDLYQSTAAIAVINNQDKFTVFDRALNQLLLKFKHWQKPIIISSLIGGFFLIGFIYQRTLIKSTQREPITITFPAPPTTSASLSNSSKSIESISQKEAEKLIQSWLKAKKDIFAPPYNRQLAAELTTDKVYDTITGLSGAIAWLKENNAYYQYEVQKIDSVEDFYNQGSEASITVKITEAYRLFKNNQLETKRTADSQLTVIYNLKFIDGKWKIASSRII
ncbi:MAG: IMS domain-containing protein [Microcoleaceae cyanobacterium MO_207.B10]|nr:IMS domain-containing protein [Microcoleaceae cyanobacterium MO_207.B10]